jgi:hypothetical protein
LEGVVAWLTTRSILAQDDDEDEQHSSFDKIVDVLCAWLGCMLLGHVKSAAQDSSFWHICTPTKNREPFVFN